MSDGVQTATTESGAEVTYVGGKALEQTDTAKSEAPATGDAQRDSEREAAVKAVREAIGKAAKEAKESAPRVAKTDGFRPPGAKSESDTEATPEPKAKAKPETHSQTKPEPDDEDVDLDKASVKQLFKHREKLAAAKREAVTQHQQEMAKIQAERQAIQQEYQRIQQERAQIQRQAQKLSALKSDPARAVLEAGWEPEDFILSLAREGTEEGKMARALRQQQQELAELKAYREEQIRQQQEYAQQQQLQHEAYRRQTVEQTFLKSALDEKARPHTAAFYKGRERALVAEGDLVAAEYRELTGKEADLDQIADYIEDQLAQRAKLWYETARKLGLTDYEAQQVAASEIGGDGGTGASVPPAGKRGKTLSGSMASERRSLGSALKDLDGEERLEAAKEAVRQALR